MKFHLTMDADQNGNTSVWGGSVILDIDVTGWSFVGGPEPADLVQANAGAFHDAIRAFFDAHLSMPGGWYREVLTVDTTNTLVELPAPAAASQDPAPEA